MSDLQSTDEELSSLMNAKQEWIDEGCPDQLGDRLRKQLKSFNVKLELHKAFLDSIEKEMETDRRERGTRREGREPALIEEPVQRDVSIDIELSRAVPGSLHYEILDAFKENPELLAETSRGFRQGGRMLPVRSQGTDIPGHVDVFKELNGLIHGGIIYTPTYTLVCKAYRYFVWTATQGSETHIDMVAGVCEQKDPSGKVIDRWSTAARLHQYYAGTSIALPTTAVDSRSLRGSGRRKFKFKIKIPPIYWYKYIHGFYMPDLFQLNKEIPSVNTLPDTGIPWNCFYTRGKFARTPVPSNAVENPFFNQPAYCSEGFPICTPYIKIFSPAPECKQTIVAMVGAFREQSGSMYRREAGWHCKTFQ